MPPLADELLPPSIAADPDPPLQVAEPVSNADSLDALSLAQGIALEQLRRPERVVQVLVVITLLAYRLGRLAGRRSGRREARRWMVPPLG